MIFFTSLINFCKGQFPYTDIGASAGLSNFKGSYGIAIGDFNKDRYEDLAITFLNGPPKVFLNMKDGTYKDVTDELHINFIDNARTSIWVDIDNDGWLDLFIGGKSKQSKLYQNIAGEEFIDVTNEYNMSQNSNIFSLNAAEINSDPFLDIYLSNFLQENALLLNDGSANLRDRVNYYQLWDDGKSMASIFFDFDNDGDDDLYLVHDGNQANILYEKIADDQYVDVSSESRSNIEAQGMGVDIGDINNDGCLDMYITNLYENNLLLNNCDGTFTDISQSAGVDDFGMGWGTTFVDYDNDGLLDIFVCNDTYFSSYTNVLFKNNGDLTFSRVNLSNIISKTASYGCVCTDIDLDGRIDLFVANQNHKDEIQLLYNQDENHHNWVGFYLEGDLCNSQAIGTRIEVVDSRGILHTDQVTGGNGYASQGSPMIHIGLKDAEIENVSIKWSDGMLQTFVIPSINTYYYVKQGLDPQVFGMSTSVDEVILDSKEVIVFPNPNSGKFSIDLSASLRGNALLRVIDIHGRILYDNPLLLPVERIDLDLDGLINKSYPFYFVELITEKETISKKLIIE